MRPKQKLKKLIILASGSLLLSCTTQSVECHHWTPQEIKQEKAELAAIPSDNLTHGVIRDYERVCTNLK